MNSDELPGENQALRERLSRLSQASLRITGDLDPNAVLQGVVDGARSLTGARTAGITALDERGQLWGFVTSGLTPEEHRLVVELPSGLEAQRGWKTISGSTTGSGPIRPWATGLRTRSSMGSRVPSMRSLLEGGVHREREPNLWQKSRDSHLTQP